MARSKQKQAPQAMTAQPPAPVLVPVERLLVFAAINSERAYQDMRANETGGVEMHRHELESYVLYMEDYMRELKTQLTREWSSDGTAPSPALNTLRKVVTLGVAAMEQHGAPRREGF